MNRYFLCLNKCFIFITCILAIVLNESPDNEPQIQTPLGTVKGLWKTTTNGRKYASFEGIPFAEPPVGALRFEEPKPVKPWIGIWNAQRIYKCPQTSFDLTAEISGTEDCLYLNIYVPETASKNLDVVAHIHGGGFMVGHAMEFLDEKYVLDRDVILVAANYRIGVLGFLSTGDDIVPGNNGMKDQVLALKWIQKNIASFGGNPNSVTLTGFSAGGASTHLHYFSPLSKGLFHRGISFSGNALGTWAVKGNPMRNTRKLAELVGCNASETKNLIECLKNRPAYLLLDKMIKHLYSFSPSPFCLFSPVVEKFSENAFLTEDPRTMLPKGEVFDVPWITSVMAQDGFIGSMHGITSCDEPPQVNSKNGPIKGYWKTSYNGRKYAAFEGIPYAEPPIGHLRFQKPMRIEHPWNEILNASKLYICPQGYDQNYIGEEDCLYLNVYIPQVREVVRLDVVVFIHGGAFMFGYGHQYIQEKYVMDRDVIFVTFNYRLGALGFLSTRDASVPGNMGMKDQVMVFKWIQENISSFGGNPQSVTLAGFSAGAASVHYHYLSPLSRNLFDRGMSMSGTAISPWALKENPIKNARKLAQLVGCDPNAKSLSACLRSKPVQLLVDKSKYLYDYGNLPFSPFAPVVERENHFKFLSDNPYKLLYEGKVKKAPWITSTTADDGLFNTIMLKPKIQEILLNWTSLAPYILDYAETVPDQKKPIVADKIKQYYFAQDATNEMIFRNFSRMFGDRMSFMPQDSALKLHTIVSSSPVYSYNFTYEGETSFKQLLTEENIKGVIHGDDTIYFFGALMDKPLTEVDRQMKDTCLDILYSYAHTGVPSANNRLLQPVGEEIKYNFINGPKNIEVIAKTDYRTYTFWSELGILENKNLLS